MIFGRRAADPYRQFSAIATPVGGIRLGVPIFVRAAVLPNDGSSPPHAREVFPHLSTSLE